ncbi:hypothetical protein [Piscinibacter sp.]|jgi:Spy/CpxP family protein refolding chaperone|uniref:hypothetical protein n=1 Tax=Piscinibacter sp. TaxID=1903157 RepID=UPI00355AA769
MLNLKSLAIGATMTLACISAFAQAASAPATPRVDKREVNQDKRIQQGVGSGQLTAKETYRLEKEQAAINKAESKAKSDGTVTKQERRRLHKMQDQASKDIYKQKHDAQTAAKP